MTPAGKKLQKEQTKRKSHYHHGLDLSGTSSESDTIIGLSRDFHKSTCLCTPSFGIQKVFVVTDSCNLTCIDVSGRRKFGSNGPVTFLECTQLSHFLQSCTGNVCMFREIISRTWHLVIIQHLFAVSDEPIARLFQWIGGVSAHGEPSFACKPRQLWSDVSSDFKLSSHVLMDVELLFVNQVRGVYIHLDQICPSTTNSIDGGIQSLDSGQDISSPVIPTTWVYRDDGSFTSMMSRSITSSLPRLSQKLIFLTHNITRDGIKSKPKRNHVHQQLQRNG